MSPFYIGLLAGLFIGVFVGIIVVALLSQNEYQYRRDDAPYSRCRDMRSEP